MIASLNWPEAFAITAFWAVIGIAIWRASK